MEMLNNFHKTLEFLHRYNFWVKFDNKNLRMDLCDFPQTYGVMKSITRWSWILKYSGSNLNIELNPFWLKIFSLY